MTKNPDRVRWPFAASWIVANTLGWTTMLLVGMAAGWAVWELYQSFLGRWIIQPPAQWITKFLSNELARSLLALLITGLCAGAIIGVIQQFILRRCFEVEGPWWVAATIGGILLSDSVLHAWSLIANVFSFSHLMLYKIGEWISFLPLGITQWLVLRRHIPRSAGWIVATTIAIGLSMLVTTVARRYAATPLVLIASYPLQGFLYGITTCLMLIVMTKRLTTATQEG